MKINEMDLWKYLHSETYLNIREQNGHLTKHNLLVALSNHKLIPIPAETFKQEFFSMACLDNWFNDVREEPAPTDVDVIELIYQACTEDFSHFLSVADEVIENLINKI